MYEIASRYWDRLWTTPDPSVRNLVALLLCTAVYAVFLSRGHERAYVRARRPQRCPDSILRGGGG